MMKVNTKKITNKTVDFWNSEYEKGYIYGLNPSEAAIRAVKLIKSKNIIKEGFRLLEIGGGYGRNAKYFAQQLRIPIKVVEISQQAVDLGKNFLQDSNKYVEYILGDVNSLDKIFNNILFDAVFHNFCLHLLDFGNRKLIYQSISKILKPKGWLIGSYLSINDHDYCKEVMDNNTILLRGKEQHFFTQEEIINELNDYFETALIEESSDKETIISDVRDTTYYFVSGIKR